MSVHWFSVLSKLIPGLQTHFLSLDLPAQIADKPELATLLQQRSMQVRKLEVLPIESIVRGYITGSAWSEYKKSGTVHGLTMPSGLKESEKLQKPIWTPSKHFSFVTKTPWISSYQWGRHESRARRQGREHQSFQRYASNGSGSSPHSYF